MFATDFTFVSSPRRPQHQMSFDPYQALSTQQPRHDGSVSPTNASSRSSTPGYYTSERDCHSCTSSPRHSSHLASQSSTSVSELSQYFNRHTIQPQRRSTPIPLDHAHPPLGLFPPHDPVDLAILSTTHAHRIARRKQSLRGLQYNPKHLHRVASLVEGMMEEEGAEDPIRQCGVTSQPSPMSLSEDSSDSLASVSSPEAEEAPSAPSYFSLDAVRADMHAAPRPKSRSSCRVEKELRHIPSHEKVMKPIRMRKRSRKESLVGGR